MHKLSSSRRRYLFAELYIIYFVCLIGGATVLTLPSEYMGYRDAAAKLLVAAIFISLIQSTAMFFHYSLKMPFKRSAIGTGMVVFIGLVLFLIGASIFSNK